MYRSQVKYIYIGFNEIKITIQGHNIKTINSIQSSPQTYVYSHSLNGMYLKLGRAFKTQVAFSK